MPFDPGFDGDCPRSAREPVALTPDSLCGLPYGTKKGCRGVLATRKVFASLLCHFCRLKEAASWRSDS